MKLDNIYQKRLKDKTNMIYKHQMVNKVKKMKYKKKVIINKKSYINLMSKKYNYIVGQNPNKTVINAKLFDYKGFAWLKMMNLETLFTYKLMNSKDISWNKAQKLLTTTKY